MMHRKVLHHIQTTQLHRLYCTSTLSTKHVEKKIITKKQIVTKIKQNETDKQTNNNQKDFKNDYIVVGCDEAGRGCVLGPLVASCVAIWKSDEQKLISMGVKDSKLLSPVKRSKLYKEILKVAVCYKVKMVSAEDIDKQRKIESLNEIQRKVLVSATKSVMRKATQNFGDLKFDVYMDSFDLIRDKHAFTTALKKYPNLNLTCVHKADALYPVTGAASIIAKVLRDKQIKKLQKNYDQNIGSGYTSDLHTISFLQQFYHQHHTTPNGTRNTWKTIDSIKGNKR
eukprot:TRINITY_DN1971_c0_g3_i1.p1 TRINITY_DN1971_c0_g3~~TRINITY_DN1971_c0_g3_i1.p1  ORF type:complete len:283 (-),score=54.13 TRINITY_DN1971_c0_g3_i1:278-1126(-)